MTKLEAKQAAYYIALQELDKSYVIESILNGEYSAYSDTINYEGYKEAMVVVDAYKEIKAKLKKQIAKLDEAIPKQKRREQARGYYNRLLNKAKEPHIWRGSKNDPKYILIYKEQDEKALKRLKEEISFEPIYQQALADAKNDDYFFYTFKVEANEVFRKTGWLEFD
ncbi:MAG: hypothetical protein ACRBFS_24380 [Aureispira sp.]